MAKDGTSTPLTRWLNMMVAIRASAPFDALSANEIQLLNELILRWQNAEDVSIISVMRELGEVAETTTYRRLIALRDKGLVELVVDEKDRRTKYARPTAAAKEYEFQLNQALLRVVKAT